MMTSYIEAVEKMIEQHNKLPIRIKELEESNKELTLQLLAVYGQAADAMDKAVVAEAKLSKAVEALKSLHHVVCGETGFASAVRNHSGKAYPWEPLDIADAQTRAVLAELEGGK